MFVRDTLLIVRSIDRIQGTKKKKRNNKNIVQPIDTLSGSSPLKKYFSKKLFQKKLKQGFRFLSAPLKEKKISAVAIHHVSNGFHFENRRDR